MSRYPLDPDAEALARVALDFLERASDPDGRFRLRCDAAGRWTDDPASDDATGRAIHGLGTAVALAPWSAVRDRARVLFERCTGFRSPHLRATAHAAIGAVEVLEAEPELGDARPLVEAALGLLDGTPRTGWWRWPEPELTYGNALLPEAQLAAAGFFGDEAAMEQALAVLEWLVGVETQHGWFSFTPVSGRGPDDTGGPMFDQQPIEAWTMVDACARAFELTQHRRWLERARRGVDWFFGANDVGVPVFDPGTHGGHDGLEPDGVNRNQGAESTLAFVGSLVRYAEIAA
ncbi:MAG: hypothetical protein U5K30_13675 [Acidimicrobiales bacterium]|nr:hypothetical protein [Acidimicrobiales bacterium]